MAAGLHPQHCAHRRYTQEQPERPTPRCDALVPAVRSGHQLYDSTVNDMGNPGIFVTYHDAQAYPEYLIKFSQ